MYSFQFENSIILNSISEFKTDFNKGLFLWVIHANKIPPHIGISLDGIELAKINKIIEAKKIGTFIVEINQEVEINDLKLCFSKHNKVVSNHTTCLTPIQDVLKLDGEKLILSELLNKIQLNDSLGKVFSLNLESDFNGILAYGKAEIENRLKLLENVKRNKSIQ